MLVLTGHMISGSPLWVLVMAETEASLKDELERLRRVADQSCTAHAVLSQKYKRISFLVDASILIMSAWLTALALAEPQYLTVLAPFDIAPKLWLGLLAVFTFCLSLIELKSEWKTKAEAHARSLTMFGEVKREAGYLLVSREGIPLHEFQRLAARYDMAGDVGIKIPDNQFLHLKRKHKIKVEISKRLDRRPSAPVLVLKVELFFRDFWTGNK